MSLARSRSQDDLGTTARVQVYDDTAVLENAAVKANGVVRSTLPQLKAAADALSKVQGAWTSSAAQRVERRLPQNGGALTRAEKLTNLCDQIQRDIASERLIDDPVGRAVRLNLEMASRAAVVVTLGEPVLATEVEPTTSNHPLNMAENPLVVGEHFQERLQLDQLFEEIRSHPRALAHAEDEDGGGDAPVVDGIICAPCEPVDEPVARDKHFACGICVAPTWRAPATAFGAKCCGVEYCGECWSWPRGYDMT